MHNVPQAYIRYAPEALFQCTRLQEHYAYLTLNITPNYLCSRTTCFWSISLGQNLSEASVSPKITLHLWETFPKSYIVGIWIENGSAISIHMNTTLIWCFHTISHPAALPTVADRRELNAIQLRSDASQGGAQSGNAIQGCNFETCKQFSQSSMAKWQVSMNVPLGLQFFITMIVVNHFVKFCYHV